MKHGSMSINGINQRPFWLVWNTTVGGLPKCKYFSYVDAEFAAKAMSGLYPDQVFTVVKALSSWATPSTGVVKITHQPESYAAPR